MPQSESVAKNGILSWLKLGLRVLAGKLYNLAGVPGIVRDCDYAATAHDVRIQVKAGDLFTVVTVNGLDIYFHRLTGGIDGVGGFNAPPSFQADSIPLSGQLPEPSASSHHNSQRHT
jgi:hypothetical protein